MIELQIRQFLEYYNIANKKVIVAFSGGVDSAILTTMLNSLSKEFMLDIYAVHINHKLRGEESDKDEKFCARFCRDLKLKFKPFKIDIKKKAFQEKKSIELTAREWRKQILVKFAKTISCNNIFLAHNEDDQIETILFRIGRGTGIKGLSGINEVSSESNCYWLRPLLNTSKENIIKWALSHGINWTNDSSNEELYYTRNKIRHKLIPLMKEVFNESFGKNVVRLGHISNLMMTEFHEMLCEKYQEHFLVNDNRIYVDLTAIKGMKLIAFSEMLRLTLANSGIYPVLPDFFTCERIYDLLFKETGKEEKLISDLITMKDRNFLLIYSNKRKGSYLKTKIKFLDSSANISLPFEEASHEFYLEFIKRRKIKFRYAVDDKVSSKNFSSKLLHDIPDWNKLKLSGKPLDKLFSEKKVPEFVINNIPIIYYNNEVVLIPGIAGKSGFIKSKGKIIEVSFS